MHTMNWASPLYQYWYAVALSAAIKKNPVAVTLLDRHIVLARDDTGELFALEDRCPHRQVPLSAGTVCQGRIQCPYHGWTFDRDGTLTHIPGLQDTQPIPSIRVTDFPVREHDGIVWLRPGQEGLPAPSTLPMSLSEQHRRFLWETQWQGNIVDAIENFMDPLHTHFLHPGLVRKGDQRQSMRVHIQSTDSGFTVDYHGQPQQSGLLYRLFESPRTRECAHYAMPGSAQIEYNYQSGATAKISLHLSPIDSTTTRVISTFHITGRWAPAWAVRLLLWPFLKKVNDQDHDMLKTQAWNKSRFPDRRNASTSLDFIRGPVEHFWQTGALPDRPEKTLEILL